MSAVNGGASPAAMAAAAAAKSKNKKKKGKGKSAVSNGAEALRSPAMDSSTPLQGAGAEEGRFDGALDGKNVSLNHAAGHPLWVHCMNQSSDVPFTR